MKDPELRKLIELSETREPREIRASTADRDRYYDILKEAYAEGRIDSAELNSRLHDLSNALTYGELEDVVRDLPGAVAPATPRRSRRTVLTLLGAGAVAVVASRFWPDVRQLIAGGLEPATEAAPPEPTQARPTPTQARPTPTPTGPTLEAEPNPTVGPIAGPVATEAGRALVKGIDWLEANGYTHAVRASFSGGVTTMFSMRYHRQDDPTLEDYIVFLNDGPVNAHASGVADPDDELIDLEVLKRMNIDEMQQMSLDVLGGQEVSRISWWPDHVEIDVTGDDYGRGSGTVRFDGAGTELISVAER